jgi:uncharacterized protein DUF4406
MKIVIVGPMTGLPDFNYPEFHAAAAAWRERGFTVSNPAETFGGDQTLPHAAYMRPALEQVLASDGIALLPGWRTSKGARVEAQVAAILELRFFDALTAEPIPTPGRFGSDRATTRRTRRKKRARARAAK